MNEKRTEGIVLRSTPFQDTNRILTLLTPEGLIRLFCYSSKKTSLPDSLTQVDLVYRARREDSMPRLIESTLINPLLEIRQSLASLNFCAEICRTLLETQLPNNPGPELYQLVLAFFKRAPNSHSLNALRASFTLKFMQYEGILPPIENPDYVTLLTSRTFTTIEAVEGDFADIFAYNPD